MLKEFLESGPKMNPLMPCPLLFSLNLNKSYLYQAYEIMLSKAFKQASPQGAVSAHGLL